VGAGEAFGLLGPNGAGKTTLIRTLLGLLHPTSGSARVFGLDSRRGATAIHARLGNLAGDFACDPRLTGRQLLELCAGVRGIDGLGRAEELAVRFHAALDRRTGEPSRGNRQKIGIIQACFHEPELLVLDEPTSGLDPLMQEEFLALIGEHVARGGTLLMSSHDLDEVQRSCTRVGIIRDGRLAAVEEVDALRSRSMHRVRVRFAGFVPDAAVLESLPGVEDLEASGPEVRFHVTGSIDPVVKALAHHDLADLEITEPSLEEVFVTYYGGTP
jgi:ABC-2 type transport system ATP-binding protein